MEDNEKNRNHEEGRKHGTGKERPKEIVQRLDKKGCGPEKGEMILMLGNT